MNRAQKLIVVGSLIVAAGLLSFLMLDWHDGWHGGTAVYIFYTDIKAGGLTDYWGLYTRYGLAGTLLGTLAPLGLLAAAVYIAIGRRISN